VKGPNPSGGPAPFVRAGAPAAAPTEERLVMSLLEKLEMTLTAAALAEEGDDDTARLLEAEIEADQAGSRERRADASAPDRGSRAR